MILCLDCGNTRLKWGVCAQGTWLASGILQHADLAQLGRQLPAGCKPETVIGCNVAGVACAERIEKALSLPVRWIEARERQCDVLNGYDDPASLGADRWAALIGARSEHRGAALVVLAGTATTIDVLGADGRHRGGLILPGLTMMANALAQGTAGLPLARGEYRQMPRNTDDAIASGAVQATLGAIERMFAALPQHEDPRCLLAGGAADVLQAHLGVPLRRSDSLVLAGLACIAAESPPHPA